jgi:hypothetical protein
MPEPTPSRRRRRWPVVLLVRAVLVLAMLWVLAKTTLRDRLLNVIASRKDVTVNRRDASRGYFLSLSLHGLTIRSIDQSINRPRFKSTKK